MKKISSLLLYVRRVFSQWWIYLGLLTGVPSALNFLNITNFKYSFSFDTTIVIFSVLLFIAGYRVWDNAHKEICSLKESPVEYKIKCKTKSFYETLEIKKDFAYVEREINSIPSKTSPEVTFGMNTGKSWDDYKKEICEYKKKLEEFCKANSSTYFVLLSIENIGYKPDEYININITSPDNIVFADFEEKKAQKPNPPEKPKAFFQTFQPSYYDSVLTYPFQRKSRFRREVDFGSEEINIELSILRAGDEVDLIYDGFFVEGNDNKIRLNLEIKSNKLKEPINKRVEVNFIV